MVRPAERRAWVAWVQEAYQLSERRPAEQLGALGPRSRTAAAGLLRSRYAVACGNWRARA